MAKTNKNIEEVKRIMADLQEVDELGTSSRNNMISNLNFIDEIHRERNAVRAEEFSEILTPGFARSVGNDMNEHFTSDMNNLLNLFRSGLNPEHAYERLKIINDGWSTHPILANSMFKYAMDPDILAAAKAGAKYSGGYDNYAGELVFDYPKTLEDRLEMI